MSETHVPITVSSTNFGYWVECLFKIYLKNKKHTIDILAHDVTLLIIRVPSTIFTLIFDMLIVQRVRDYLRSYLGQGAYSAFMVSEPGSPSSTASPPSPTSSSSSGTKMPSQIHPALMVSNIRNHISITLEMENVQYSTWAELFKIHARSHRVYHHIIKSEAGIEKVPSTEEEKELWLTLDATVLQWIYATISHDLLHTIFEPDSTAMEA
ncbi:hypothetical protein LXL04_018170 [Taraxacum kok-saghyz]